MSAAECDVTQLKLGLLVTAAGDRGDMTARETRGRVTGDRGKFADDREFASDRMIIRGNGVQNERRLLLCPQ